MRPQATSVRGLKLPETMDGNARSTTSPSTTTFLPSVCVSHPEEVEEVEEVEGGEMGEDSDETSGIAAWAAEAGAAMGGADVPAYCAYAAHASPSVSVCVPQPSACCMSTAPFSFLPVPSPEVIHGEGAAGVRGVGVGHWGQRG